VATAATSNGVLAGAFAGGAALIATLAVIYATPSDSFWIVDCGAKALLAERFVETGFGSLELDYPAVAFDPEGDAFPIGPPFAVEREGRFFSQYPPAYPALAAPFLAWLGAPGLRLPAALGAAACAFLFALWTAPVVGTRWAAAAGLALVLATPLFFYGVTVWEHSITVALPLAAVVVLSQRSAARLLLAGSLLGAACWLREELVFALPALAIACFLRDRSPRDVLCLGLGALPVLAALLAFNAVAYGDPLGVHVTTNLHALPPAGEIFRDLAAVLSGRGASLAEGVALATASVFTVALGLRVRQDDAAWTACVAGAALVGLLLWLRGTVAIAGADIPFVELVRFNGFALQMPLVCLAGIGAVRLARHEEFSRLRLGVVAGVGFLALTLPFRVTLSDFASGGHWGPRMLLPAVPALACLALTAVRPAVGESAAGVAPRRAAWAALVVAGLASSSLAVSLLTAQKREIGELQERIAAAPEPVVVTTHAAHGQLLASLWGEKPMLLATTPRALDRVIDGLQRHGAEEFLLVWRPAHGISPRSVSGARCEAAGRHTGRHVRRVFDVEFASCALAKADSSALEGTPIHR